ncbi:MAG: multidrug effflux MFS transporter [Gammaproteobacteria bacterium]|nr:multidrug effflux MFS transporter [Gammaproteobacteria bacterium]
MTSQTNNPTRPGSRQLTFFASVLSMIAPFSINTYLPSFPDIEQEFGISRVVLSQSLGVYLFAFATSTLFWGPLADRVGRRLVILISMTVYTLASIGCALASNAEVFLLLRILQGLSASGGVVAARAMIRDAHSAEAARRAMSQAILWFAIAPAIAPILGGWLHEMFGWRSVFWFLCSFGCLMILMAIFTPETLGEGDRRSIHPGAVVRTYFNAMLHKQFPVLVLSWALAFAGQFLYVAGAPTVIYDFLGLGTDDFAWLFLPLVAGLILGAAISSRLTHRWSAEKTISAGFLMMILASAISFIIASFWAASIPGVIGPLLLYVTGFALMLPGLTVLALDCMPTHRGSAASLQGFLQMLTGAGVASFAVPLLNDRWLNFVLGQALFLLLAVGLWYRLQRKTEQKE